MSDKETAPRCPKCSQPLQRVRYPSESMLNCDQWDSIRAGDWFCECHNNHAGNQPYAYFWEKDLRVAVECTAPAPLPGVKGEDFWIDELEYQIGRKVNRDYLRTWLRAFAANLKRAATPQVTPTKENK